MPKRKLIKTRKQRVLEKLRRKYHLEQLLDGNGGVIIPHPSVKLLKKILKRLEDDFGKNWVEVLQSGIVEGKPDQSYTILDISNTILEIALEILNFYLYDDEKLTIEELEDLIDIPHLVDAYTKAMNIDEKIDIPPFKPIAEDKDGSEDEGEKESSTGEDKEKEEALL